jgi:hypothetical protein
VPPGGFGKTGDGSVSHTMPIADTTGMRAFCRRISRRLLPAQRWVSELKRTLVVQWVVRCVLLG